MAVDAGHTSHAGGGHQSQAVTHLHRDINRRIVDANSVVRVLDIVEDASQDFNAVNISTAFHRLARMWRDLPDLSASSSGGQGRLDNALQDTTHAFLLSAALQKQLTAASNHYSHTCANLLLM